MYLLVSLIWGDFPAFDQSRKKRQEAEKKITKKGNKVGQKGMKNQDSRNMVEK